MPNFTRKFINLLIANPNIELEFIGIEGNIYFKATIGHADGDKVYKLSVKPDAKHRMVTVKTIQKNVPTAILGRMDIYDFRVIFG